VPVLKIIPNALIKYVSKTFIFVVTFMAYLISNGIQRAKELGCTTVCEFPELGIGTSDGYV
jgi:hypothetical protein